MLYLSYFNPKIENRKKKPIGLQQTKGNKSK